MGIDPNLTERKWVGRGVTGTPFRRFVPQLWTRVDAPAIVNLTDRERAVQDRQCDLMPVRRYVQDESRWMPALAAGSSRFMSVYL